VAHPVSYPIGTGDPSLEVKRPEREAELSPPFSAKITMSGDLLSLP
jgi:hypothetical protein